MPTLVALDIETTGLDPKKDAILEIGAVRFYGRRVEDEWTTLINPGRAIPPFITQLTGITNEMIAHAPPVIDVLGDLDEFVGDATIVGHNINFDLGFLRKHRLFRLNEALDTYEMASVLVPTASRYNLGALAQRLAVALPATHRALDDARVTHGIFLRLIELAQDLPVELLAEFVQSSEQIDWGGYWGFSFALQERSRSPIRGKKSSPLKTGDWFGDKRRKAAAALTPRPDLIPLVPDEIASFLEFGGAFSHHFPYFEFRPQQVEMTRVVTQALSEGRHLMVEAGTGVGKSIAYLLPAALWSLQNNSRVVVSTNTINLQDQLIHKDIPDLQSALDLDLRAIVLKGRSNYLCPRRLDNLRRRGPRTPEEMRILGKVLVWMQDSASGDRGEINLNGPAERDVWFRLSAEDEACTTETCLQRTGGGCPFFLAHQAAQGAHLVVVNHALLLADIATGNRVLPEYDYLIIDEAHHLEGATTDALAYRITFQEVERLLRELGGSNSGTLGWALKAVDGLITPSDLGAYSQLIARATDLAFQFDEMTKRFFEALEQFLFEQREGRPIGPYAHQERILPATRHQPAWMEVEAQWEDSRRVLGEMLDILAKLTQALADLTDVLSEEGQDIYSQVSGLFRRFKELLEQLDAFVFNPQPDQIYWTEIQSDGRKLSLHAAPLHIGPLMEKYLWHEKSSVILTSATLTAAGNFDYLRDRLQAADADELSLGSPFDYESSALLYLPNDIPEPADRQAYQRALDYGLIHLCRATGGRALILFTSYAQLRSTAQVLSGSLAEDGILVFEQGEGASSHTLLENFRSAEKAVLLGTRAFWEGVDVPGAALSVLAIAKLPFDVPSDPIVAARAETFEDSFYQYALPEAILRFRQGFGRLIRTQSDRGVVAILDRRVLTKRYGQAFLESLPPCTVQVGPLANLARAAANWLNL
jgi:DNA polymerase-3 subunit epsilon/ATP-dependent DNA helicase DinG